MLFVSSWGLLFLITFTLGVDRNNFKTCEQSSFCRRLRGIEPGNVKYKVNFDSVHITETALQVDFNHVVADASLKLTLTALVSNTFRLTVDEINPRAPRYVVEGVLHNELQTNTLKLLERTQESIAIASGPNKVILYRSPFKIEFYQDGHLSVVANARDLFAFEYLRTKPNQIEEEGIENDAAEQPPAEDPGAWEENFKSHHDTKPRGPEAIGLDFTFPGAHGAFGLPEHADRFLLRNTGRGGTEPYRLYNLDVFEYELDSTMALYGAVPVLYAHGPQRTTGVFWLNAAETWVDTTSNKDTNVVSSIVNLVSGQGGHQQVDAHFMSESGIIDAFILLGPTPREAMRQYAALTGTAPLPQYFTLAYHQCRWNYMDEGQVREVVTRMDETDLPLDVMWLDIEYTDNKKYFTWDPKRFPHPTEMVQNLTATGRKLVAIIDPHIKREGGYFVHEDSLANGYYVKNKDGSVYEGWCWPGSSSYLDVFDPKVREYYASLFAPEKFSIESNDVHIWNDMNEPSVFNGPEITMPKDVMHYGDWEHRHVHNLYGLFFTMGTYDGLISRYHGKLRPFILTRSHFAGTQRYAIVWTGDNAAEWSHLEMGIPMCLSEAVAGISFCGADVGGFFKNPDVELLERWYQAGAWLPFYRAHAHIDATRREPYRFGDEVAYRIRRTLRLRYALLPLWYTLFWEHENTGDPVIRPLLYHFPAETEAYNIDYELLIGSSILARPVTEAGATSVNVYFPGGSNEIWYDIDDFKPFYGVGHTTIPVNLEKSPAYYRGGSIIARKDRPRRSSALTHDDPYTLYVALDIKKSATGTLYIDDGESFEYHNKKYVYLRFNYQNGILSSGLIDQTSFPTKAWLEKVVIIGAPANYQKAALTYGNGAISQALKLKYDEATHSLIIRKPGVNIDKPFKITLQ